MNYIKRLTVTCKLAYKNRDNEEEQGLDIEDSSITEKVKQLNNINDTSKGITRNRDIYIKKIYKRVVSRDFAEKLQVSRVEMKSS